jgi:hypothetical protein
VSLYIFFFQWSIEYVFRTFLLYDVPSVFSQPLQIVAEYWSTFAPLLLVQIILQPVFEISKLIQWKRTANGLGGRAGLVSLLHLEVFVEGIAFDEYIFFG